MQRTSSLRGPLPGRILTAALLVFAAAACSSGGSGGGSGGGVVSPAPPPPPPPPPPPDPPQQDGDPADFETQEYDRTNGLAIVNASSAYAAGASGQGITIAVIDTGTDADHPDLQGQILTTSFDVNASARGADDPGDGHGSFVSGIIAGIKDDNGIHGIAFNSQILDIRADTPGSCTSTTDDDGCSFIDPDLVVAINEAVARGADIINLSLGGTIDQDPTLENAIRDAVSQGVLVVISAGNEAAPAGPDPDDPDRTLPATGLTPNEPGYIAGEAASLGRVVAVGSIDLQGNLSDFSNRAGADARNYYILAPGEDILTTGPDGAYFRVGGTSFAAPYVSGALALMLDAFPNIAPEVALEILLDTAADYVDTTPDPVTGEVAGVGTDNVTGVGVLDLEAAFRPQGAATMAFGTATIDLSQSLSAASGAFGDWAQASGAFDGLMFLDSYGRGFSIEEAQLAASGGVTTSLEARALWAAGEARAVRAGRFSLSWNRPALAPDPTIPYEREPETFYTARLDFNGGLVEFGRGGRLPTIAPRVSLIDEAGTSSALGGNGEWARITRDIGRYSVDAFSSDNEWQDITGVGLSRYGDRWVARAAFSSIENTASALGGSLQSRFGARDTTSMEAYTLEAAARPFGAVTLSAGMEAAAILLPGVEAQDVWTSRWSMGATAPLGGGDISFVVAQPRRAESGRITFAGPVAITEDNVILYDDVTAGLVPSGRQIDIETRWQVAFADDISGTASYAIATSPHHVADAEAERVFWLSLRGDM